jgi:Alginate lyase
LKFILHFLLIALLSFSFQIKGPATILSPGEDVKNILRQQIMKDAAWALAQLPVTVTAASSPRSAGGKHDFFSEGDYWWPNPASADSPYIQKDGMTNPDNFVAHRHAMIRLSRIMGALASAYKITGDKKYVQHALIHCKAWFTDTATMMHPHLLYAQAIKGRFTGRGIGVIDGIQLIETVQALMLMNGAKTMDQQVVAGTKKWFEQFLQWLTTHQYGKDEMNAINNHGTCWVMQAAVFAKFTGNKTMMQFCSDRFKNVLLPNQMAADGSFPLELKRTKPYGYSIFNMDAMTTICQTLSSAGDNLWNYQTADGKSIKKGIDYLYPFIADKTKWPLKPDVMFWNEWPVAQPFLLFGASAFNNKAWFNTWSKLQHSPKSDEVIRNLPVRNPLIWL